MTTQEALQVLKASRTHGLTQIGNSIIIPTTIQYYQALTIAIDIMEGRKEEIMKAWIDGHNRLLPSKQDELREHAEQYYNSNTETR